MKIYPLLATFSKVNDKESLEGLIRGELKATLDHDKPSEYTDELSKALALLEEASSIEDFLKAAKNL